MEDLNQSEAHQHIIWDINTPKQRKVEDNDLRKVQLDVDCIFKWSDKIPEEVDDEGNVITYTSGYIMEVLPNQKFLYKGEDTMFIASVFSEKEEKICTLIEVDEDFIICDVASCCKRGPITDQKYCSECGNKIIRE